MHEAPRTPKLSGEVRHGDAFDLIGDLLDRSVDLLLTSPPYWGLRTYGLNGMDDVEASAVVAGRSPLEPPTYESYRDSGGILGMEPFPEWYVSHLVDFFSRASRVLKRSGSVWINLGDTYFARWSSIRDQGRQGYSEGRTRRRAPAGGYRHDKQLLLIPARFAIAMQDAGWILRNDLIWAKPAPLPRPESDRLKLSHEHWFHFVHRQPSARPKYYYDLSGSEAGGRDVITCAPTASRGGHSAAFPPAVIRPRILSSSPPTGLVLDPFCGTGRALTESLQLQRNALGFELSEVYAAIAESAVRASLADLTAKGCSLGHTDVGCHQ